MSSSAACSPTTVSSVIRQGSSSSRSSPTRCGCQAAIFSSSGKQRASALGQCRSMASACRLSTSNVRSATVPSLHACGRLACRKLLMLGPGLTARGTAGPWHISSGSSASSSSGAAPGTRRRLAPSGPAAASTSADRAGRSASTASSAARATRTRAVSGGVAAAPAPALPAPPESFFLRPEGAGLVGVEGAAATLSAAAARASRQRLNSAARNSSGRPLRPWRKTERSQVCATCSAGLPRSTRATGAVAAASTGPPPDCSACSCEMMNSSNTMMWSWLRASR
mmetsp:Transcript_44020/g.110475  ORF Transcript_44020/g.110475 Transcript_44020/m.110475 type:complete len:282 (-) Transcript_44020:235-1080(-)